MPTIAVVLHKTATHNVGYKRTIGLKTFNIEVFVLLCHKCFIMLFLKTENMEF